MLLTLLFWFWGLTAMWLLTAVILAARLNREATEPQTDSV